MCAWRRRVCGVWGEAEVRGVCGEGEYERVRSRLMGGESAVCEDECEE